MATFFILSVFVWFVIASDAGIAEKLVLAVLCAVVALLPIPVPETRLAVAIAQGAIGIYLCLRMTYLRARDST